MSKRVGLKDIAEALNISITTVSRGLNNKFDISKQTREAILKKADELNYRPNAYAVSLRKNEYFTIGVIVPSVDHYFFSTVLKGIMNKAHISNYLVIIGESTHDLQKEKEVIEQFVSHCVTGVIISPSNKSSYSNNLEYLAQKRIPYIVVDRPVKESQAPCVKYDDPNGAFLVVEHLIRQGYKKIAFLKGYDYCVISNARFQGYKEALAKYDIPFNPNLVKTCHLIDQEDQEQEGFFAVKQLMLSKDKPDAIFAVNDDLAAGAYKLAEKLNLNIPNDLGVAGYSNSQISRHLKPALTTVEQPGMEMGELAFDFLQQSIIGNKTKLQKTFDARLIIRDSSVKAAQRSTSNQTDKINYADSL